MKCYGCGAEMEMKDDDVSLEKVEIFFECLECPFKTKEIMDYDVNGRVINVTYIDIEEDGNETVYKLI